MSYRCSICTTHVSSGPMLRCQVLRPADGSIEREVAVCGACDRDLRAGISYDRLKASWDALLHRDAEHWQNVITDSPAPAARRVEL